MTLYKNADIGLGAIIVIIIVVLFMGWLINEGWKECRLNSDCKPGQYCTSQFECMDIPKPEKASPDNNIVAASAIIGICFIIAALIMRWETVVEVYNRLRGRQTIVKEEYTTVHTKGNTTETKHEEKKTSG